MVEILVIFCSFWYQGCARIFYMKTLRIGSRGSLLALKQAEIVKNLLLQAHPQLEISITAITTTGDKILDRNLNQIIDSTTGKTAGKGLFIKEIEEQLLAEKIDLAVHSLKDMPAKLEHPFTITAVTERENVQDAIISVSGGNIMELKPEAVVATSSLRRAVQVLKLRPDVRIIGLRGNIGTRIDKLKAKQFDATFLAMAGLIRSNLFDPSYMQPVTIDEMLPAVGQGAIAIETLSNNQEIQELVKTINHEPTYITTKLERNFMAAFEGSCTTPIAAYAHIENDQITLKTMIAKKDASSFEYDQQTSPLAVEYQKLKTSEDLGHLCANNLKARISDDFFD